MNKKILETKDLQVGMLVKVVAWTSDPDIMWTELGYVLAVGKEKAKLRIITDKYDDFRMRKHIETVTFHHNFNDGKIVEMNKRNFRILFLPKQEYDKFLAAKLGQYEKEIETYESMIQQKNLGIELLAFNLPKYPRRKVKE